MTQKSSSQTFYKPQEYRLEESIVFLMLRNQLTFERLADLRLAHLGITSSQMRVLLLAAYAESTTASTISRLMGSHAASVVRTIDRLEAKGWLQRARSCEDRRLVNLCLTDAGKKIAAQIPNYLCETLNASLDGFTEEEFKLLKRLLNKITENNFRQLGNELIEALE